MRVFIVAAIRNKAELNARTVMMYSSRRYRTVQIRAGQHILSAEDPLPPDLREILALIR
jgi:hypothetical protein